MSKRTLLLILYCVYFAISFVFIGVNAYNDFLRFQQQQKKYGVLKSQFFEDMKPEMLKLSGNDEYSYTKHTNYFFVKTPEKIRVKYSIEKIFAILTQNTRTTVWQDVPTIRFKYNSCGGAEWKRVWMWINLVVLVLTIYMIIKCVVGKTIKKNFFLVFIFMMLAFLLVVFSRYNTLVIDNCNNFECEIYINGNCYNIPPMSYIRTQVNSGISETVVVNSDKNEVIGKRLLYHPWFVGLFVDTWSNTTMVLPVISIYNIGSANKYHLQTVKYGN